MTETLLLVSGCVVFAITTIATLLYGYMVVNRAWLADSPGNGPPPFVVPVVVPVPDPLL